MMSKSGSLTGTWLLARSLVDRTMTGENDLRKPQRKTANPDIVLIHHHRYLKCQLSVKIHYPLPVDPEVRRHFFTILIGAFRCPRCCINFKPRNFLFHVVVTLLCLQDEAYGG